MLEPKEETREQKTGIMNPVKALENHGQAVWLDFLARGFVAKGDLKKLIDSDGVKGVTSNPSIFEKAIGSSDEYDTPIGKALRAGDRPVADLFVDLCGDPPVQRDGATLACFSQAESFLERIRVRSCAPFGKDVCAELRASS